MSKECCKPKIGSLIHAYELGQLTEDETHLFESHLLECEFCLDEVSNFQEICQTVLTDYEVHQALNDMVPEKPRSESVWSRIWRHLWPETNWLLKPVVAYSAVALVALIVAPWLLRDLTDLPPPEVLLDMVYQPSDTDSVHRVPLRTQRPLGLRLKSVQRPDATEDRLLLSTFGIEIQPATETYLYLVQWDTSGFMRILFPNTEYSSAVNPLTPGRSYRLPERHDWFSPDSASGGQTITYVASSRPWKAIEENIEKLMTLSDQLRSYGPAGEALRQPNVIKEFISTADDIRALLSEAEKDKGSRYKVERSSFRYGPDAGQ
jgi:hypothetical protein